MPVEKALGVLNFTPRIAASHIAKTLKSAAANALHKEGTDNLKPEDMVVKDIIVGAAPTAKRIRFQSMGRVFRYRKRFCHLTVLLEAVVSDEEKPKRKTKKTTKAKAAGDKKDAKPKAATKKKSGEPAAKKKATPKAKTATKKAADSAAGSGAKKTTTGAKKTTKSAPTKASKPTAKNAKAKAGTDKAADK